MRRVSVIVPTYDRPLMLREALASIRALDAAYDDIEFEIIVGDNGRTDATRRSCEDFGAIYAPAHGRGASYARNAALKMASGEFVTFLDDDDAWLAGHIRPHIAFLDAHPKHEGVFGQAIYVDPVMKPLGDPWPEKHPGEGDDLLRALLGGLFPQIGTVVVRREVVARIGYFDARLVGGQDLDWLLRIARAGKLGFVPTPCIHFRCRPPGASDALQRMRIGFDCRVFLRHGLPVALRVWKSPISFIRAYHASLFHFYEYFTGQAIRLAEEGSLRQVAAMLQPLAIYMPLLLVSDFLRPSALRSAIGSRLLRRKLSPRGVTRLP